MNATFIAIEDEFNRLFKLLSARECMRNSRLMKQVQRIRLRILAIREELVRQKFAREAEV